ncbi:hypothetical protein CAPTEDRAFT_185607 [Capitella teleta]|uniref:Uncharacterized protein n=1 Tax=Capitella teleta TaxID=283909 RepID=R7V8H9_CAPTE|nr:hypothetical protein CAPTEDRAFT_185607 [Capitella teleta]|eukprot:ELU12651.1 hypothetical protein CAPTEDRAFT_185607 [Capitella teleta]
MGAAGRSLSSSHKRNLTLISFQDILPEHEICIPICLEYHSQLTKFVKNGLSSLIKAHSIDLERRKVVVIVISIIIVLVVVIIILVWCLYKSKRNCNPPADPREEKGMLPGSSTSSTPDSSLSYEMNRAECNAQYGPPSSVFSSLTASSLPDNASTHTVEVDNMPLEHQEQGTKQKYLWPLNSSPDSGVNLLETDCVPSMEDEETLPKVDTLKDPLDSAEKSLPNGPSLKGKIKTNVPSQPPLHINKVKNCNIFIQCGDNNRLYQNPVPSSSFSDSEDEHANYDLREEVAEEEDVSV